MLQKSSLLRMTHAVNVKSYKGKHNQGNAQWLAQKEASFYFLHFPCHIRKQNKNKHHYHTIPLHLSLIDGISGLNSEIKKDKVGWTIGQLLNQPNI